MIHYITPGRSDKNLGKAINDTVKLLPDDAWICLRDIDTVPAYHEKFYEQVEQLTKQSEFDIVGCMTNRSGMVEQLIEGVISNNSDWRYHRVIGRDLYRKNKFNIKPCKTTLAGMFLLFKKDLWSSVGGWREGSIRIKGSFVDWHFCNDASKLGFKMGIATGLYMIHLYRPDHIDPRGQTKHLERI